MRMRKAILDTKSPRLDEATPQMAQPPPASHWLQSSLNHSSHNGTTPEPRAPPGVSRRSLEKLTCNKLLGMLDDNLSTYQRFQVGAKSYWNVPIRKPCKLLTIWDSCIQTLNSSTCNCCLSGKSCRAEQPCYTSYVQTNFGTRVPAST